MNEKKGTTGMVAYIALLMVAGASLWHREDSFHSGGLQASALSARTYPYEFRTEEVPGSGTFRIELSGRTYEARIVSEDDGYGTMTKY